MPNAGRSSRNQVILRKICRNGTLILAIPGPRTSIEAISLDMALRQTLYLMYDVEDIEDAEMESVTRRAI